MRDDLMEARLTEPLRGGSVEVFWCDPVQVGTLGSLLWSIVFFVGDDTYTMFTLCSLNV